VSFKLTLQASFHPSVGGCTVSLPWIDATGAVTSSVSIGPLKTCDAEPSRAGTGGRGANRVRAEKELGSFNVSLDLVKGLQNLKLPLSVSADGSDSVASEAKLFVGPLLLAGTKALSPETLRPGEPARSKRLRPNSSVSATWTETIGVAGLYSIDVTVSTDIPILSPEMLERLMPACFKVEMVRGLPNEPGMPEKFEDVFVEVYPKLSAVTEGIGETCIKLRTESRPHNKTATFQEPMIWLLGLAPPHAVREWLQHEGLIVEIHDRDPRAKKAEEPVDGEGEGEGQPPSPKKPIHAHGVAQFALGPLLKSETLELALRADVFPARGDKKKRRAEAMSGDSLGASGLLEEEGRQRIARRAGLDKREDTTDYHTLGTVCTLRAALGFPVPAHWQIQNEEHEVHRSHWESTEENVDGTSVFAGKVLEKTESAANKPTNWAPKSQPFRAKVGEALGPWRRSQGEAEEDAKKMGDVPEDDPAASQAIAEGLIQAVPAGAKSGLDCRYERYGRIVLTVSEANQDTDGEVTRAVLANALQTNAAILGLDPKGGEFLVRELSEEEQTDPHLDIITGFCLLDGRMRIFVLEGLREGHSFQKLLEVIPRGPEAPKLLHNPVIGFGERLYASFGPRLKQIKVRGTIEKLASRPGLYSWSKSSSEADIAGNEAPKMLMDLKSLTRLRAVRESTHFPKASQVAQVELLYGAYVSDNELEGRPPSPDNASSKLKLKKSNVKSAGSSALSSKDIPEMGMTGQSAFLAEAVTSQELHAEHAGTKKFQTRKTLKAQLDQQNPTHEESIEIRATAEVQDFRTTNKKLVRAQSETNVRLNDMLGKKRERETPFIPEGQVYLYSTQKLNSAELQKDWMRKQMDGHSDKKMWSFSPTYMSQSFEFSGAAPPGVQQLQPKCPSDTYARQEGDERPVFRMIQARPKEAYRKPARDLDQSTVELLHEPFEENEWHQLACGDARRRPTGADETFHMDKVPHQRKDTYPYRPFDSQHQLLKPGDDFGPTSGFESVHYHGRRSDEDRQEQYLMSNLKEREAHGKKIRAHKNMRSFSQTATRTGVVDLDRSERLLKDQSVVAWRGRLDDRAPDTMRTMEIFHDLGRPDLEFQARLRENDDNAPFDVTTGGYIRRDPEVGTGNKRSRMNGSLARAPWRHDGTSKHFASATSKVQVDYGSHKDFNGISQPPGSRVVETHLWKSASRTAISPKERSGKLQYLRPHHYGVEIS